MAQIRTVGRRKRRRRRQRRADEEERVRTRPAQAGGERLGMVALQQQVGNQAVQRLLAQRQAEAQKENKTESQDGVGEIKIERPKIEYYDVSGEALADVLRQAQEEKEWRQEEYKYELKKEEGIVTEVNVTVQPIIKLPRWVGPGWEKASDGERLAWFELLESLNIDQDPYEETTELPRQWWGLDWSKAPAALKSQWQTMLQRMHKDEQQPEDRIRRRALVLQQRLLGRPETEAKANFDQFIEDLKIEQEAYSRQEEFGQEQKVSLGTSVMMQ